MNTIRGMYGSQKVKSEQENKKYIQTSKRICN